MPEDYEKPEYVPNTDSYQSNEDKYYEAEQNDTPRENHTDSDYTRTPQ